MSKKNSIVLNHKNCFSEHEQITNFYLNFKNILSNFKSKSFLVAVSGGPDSLALAALCKAYESETLKKKFHYVHINHAIRKKADQESKRVKKILSKQNIDLKIIKNRKKIVKNVQHNARVIRYSLMSAECKKKKINSILTAHHKNDQIETFLIRLSRGSGIKGLSSMSTISELDKNIKIYRPLLSVNKKELIMITKKVFGEYIKDPSNRSKKFLRSNIRQLIPLLEKYGIKNDQVIRSINNIKSSNQTIDLYLKNVIKRFVKKNKNKLIISKKNLFSLSPELQLRTLGFMIKSLNNSEYPPRSKKLFTALELMRISKKIKYSLSNCYLKVANGQVKIEKA